MIYTSQGDAYLHLPGVIMIENSIGQTRYLLGDGLGSIRQAVDETAQVVSYYEFDPYGNAVNNNGGEPYGYTGEWYGGYTELLHLRARWYSPESGTFLSRDPVESEPPYQYVRGNPVNWTDPSGTCAQVGDEACWGVYERIVQLCPECSQLERSTFTGDHYLYEENIYYLRSVLERVKTGWRPLSQQQGLLFSLIEECNGTFTFSWSLITLDFPVEFDLAVNSFSIDKQGNMALGSLTITPLTGGATAIQATTGPSVLLTNANNLSELQGWFVNAGIGGELKIVSAGVDFVTGSEGKNGHVIGINPNLSFGLATSIPPVVLVYGHGNANFTPDWALFTYNVNTGNPCFGNCKLSSLAPPSTTPTPTSDPYKY